MLVTPASLPTSPTSPDRVLDLGIAVIVGLALGVGTALLRDRIDDHLRGLSDLETQAAAPALGLIPAFVPRRLARTSRPTRSWWRSPAPSSRRPTAASGRGCCQATPGNSKAVLVTSPGWEDKSTVAANLAAAIAQSGRQVVLVCADLRWRPGAWHSQFAPGNGCGLSGLLEGRANLEEALQATEVPGLRLLPPGVTPADQAALLGRFAWRMALGDMRMLADVVVIEAPPVLTGADVQPLANLAEMILMVTDAKRTTRAQLRAAVREVQRMRGNLAGCVLDNVGRRRRLRSPRLGSPRLEPVADGHAEADRRVAARSHVALIADQGHADPDIADSDLPDRSADQEWDTGEDRDTTASPDSGEDRDTTASPDSGEDRDTIVIRDAAADQSVAPIDDAMTGMLDPAGPAQAIQPDPVSASSQQDSELAPRQ